MKKFIAFFQNWFRKTADVDRLRSIFYLAYYPGSKTVCLTSATYDLNWSPIEPIGFNVHPVSRLGVEQAIQEAIRLGAECVDVRVHPSFIDGGCK